HDHGPRLGLRRRAGVERGRHLRALPARQDRPGLAPAADPDGPGRRLYAQGVSAMFARIRWHLVGWNVLVVGLILGVLGTVLYVGTSRNLLEQVDRDLASRGE